MSPPGASPRAAPGRGSRGTAAEWRRARRRQASTRRTRGDGRRRARPPSHSVLGARPPSPACGVGSPLQRWRTCGCARPSSSAATASSANLDAYPAPPPARPLISLSQQARSPALEHPPRTAASSNSGARPPRRRLGTPLLPRRQHPECLPVDRRLPTLQHPGADGRLRPPWQVMGAAHACSPSIRASSASRSLPGLARRPRPSVQPLRAT